jgi:hypothetical protein
MEANDERTLMDKYIYTYDTLDPSGPFTKDRRKIRVSDTDYDKFFGVPSHHRKSWGWIAITDLDTEEKLMIRWADCGLDCFCAAEWMTMRDRSEV